MDEETKKQFRKFAELYGLVKDDFQQLHKMFIIKRRGIEKIMRGLEAEVSFEVVPEFTDISADKYCIKCYAKKKDSTYVVTTYGESSPDNTKVKYPVAICEKRAMARAILKLANLYELPVHAEEEINPEDNE